MRVYHYRHASGITNYGDEIGPWLADRCLPQSGTQLRSDLVLLLCGSLLDSTLIRGPKLIFGAGYCYGRPAKPDPSWDVRFVRGPKTAEVLGLPQVSAITDSAALLGLFFRRAHTRKYRISYMPRFDRFVQASAHVRDPRIHLIDPRCDVETVTREIADSEVLVTEALHGAVAADALRIPWVSISVHSVHDFKWNDWAESLELRLHQTVLPPLEEGDDAAATIISAAANGNLLQLSNPSILRHRVARMVSELGKLRDQIWKRYGPFSPTKEPAAAEPPAVLVKH